MADKKISQLTDGNPAQSNDQIPISRAGANFRITPGSIVNLGVASLTGTANQVIVSAATGAVTLSLPQSIAASSTVSFAGMSLSGNLSMGSNYITNLAVPQNANDAANKTYVDQVAEGLRTKSSDQVATTADLNATYNNGALGVGATLISNVNGPFPTIDGVSGLGVGAQILVKNQTNAAENGTYSLTTQGTAGTPWVLTRDPSTDTASEIPGSYIFVTGGTLYAGTGWVLTVANASTFVVGTDAITVSQFSGAGAYSAGTGLVLVGTQFSTTGQVLALANLSTNGLIARTASNTLAARTLTASTGISIADGDGVSGNPTITNTAPDQVVTLSSGTGISTSGTYPSFTITNTAPDQVVTLSSGTGISTSGSYPSFTITNTAPDQTVVLSAGTGISTSGTYPSFTITNSDPGSSQNIFKNIAVAGQSTIIADSNNDTLTVASGTGISLTTNDSTDTLTITNNAPDQTVVLSSGTGISVSGTYPSFTITNSAPDQTVSLSSGTGISVTGSYPSFTITNSSPGSGQNIFKNIAVAGQSTIVADTNDDTLTIAAGTGITLTTNASTDTLTITASGGSGVASIAGSNGLTASASTGAVTMSLNSDLRGNVSTIGLDSGDYIGWTNNSHTSFFINAGERVRFESDGTIQADGNVVAYSTTISDERLKKNIVLVDNALEIISRLDGVTFEYIKDGRKSAGVVAQQLEKVFPSAVKETKSPFFSETNKEELSEIYKIVEYSQLTALFIEAIKALNKKVAELEAKLNSGA